MECVTTDNFFMLTWSIIGLFVPARGILQGDPLSPYLFLFVTGALAVLLNDSISRGALQDFKICRQSPGISE